MCDCFFSGGPGSRKGRIVDDLVNVYGFNLLSIEELIHKDLPLKLSNSVKLTNILDIKEVIEVGVLPHVHNQYCRYC